MLLKTERLLTHRSQLSQAQLETLLENTLFSPHQSSSTHIRTRVILVLDTLADSRLLNLGRSIATSRRLISLQELERGGCAKAWKAFDGSPSSGRYPGLFVPP
jgi:hypothetical protein